jgi:hypothetical protein
MVKVTLEFEGVEQAIVALGKLGGIVAAPAEKAPRKGRNDKGQPREPYKPRAQDGAAAKPSVEAGTKSIDMVGSGDGQGTQQGVTESGSATSAGPSTVPVIATVAPAAAAPSPSDVVKAEIKQQQTAQGTGFPEPTIGEKDAEAQAAIEAVYGKFGIDKVRVLLADFGIDKARNLPKSKKADFLAAAKALVA